MALIGKAIAQQIAASKAAGGGNNFKPGFDGEVEVVECKGAEISTKKRPTAHLAAIVEFKVLQTNDAKLHPVGASVSILEEIDAGAQYPAQAMGRLKALILALLDVREDEITEEQAAEQIVLAFNKEAKEGPVNPLKGYKLKLETYAKERGEGKAVITKFKFKNPASVGEEAAAAS